MLQSRACKPLVKKANALICMGGNLAVAMPDKDACFAGMKKLDLAVHTATKPIAPIY